MITLKGKKVYLRALEPEDLEFIYQIENNQEIWEVSNTNTPYSRFLVKQYLENAHQDIYQAKQLRLAICELANKKAIGLIDIFEYDPKNNRAGIGILIQNEAARNLGFGSEALGLLVKFAFYNLNINMVYANIATDNQASKKLFTKFGFKKIGAKKQWNLVGGVYKDEILYQLIR